MKELDWPLSSNEPQYLSLQTSQKGIRKWEKADKLRFINIAQGSLEECRYYVILSKDLGYITEDDANQMYIIIEDASRLLNAYGKKIKESTFVNDINQWSIWL